MIYRISGTVGNSDGLLRRRIAYLGLLALASGRPNLLSTYLLVPIRRRCAGASDENNNTA